MVDRSGQRESLPSASRDAPFPVEAGLRQLIETVQDHAIFLLDPAGHVVSWNAGARTLSGHEAQEILGSHFSRLFSAEDVERGWPQHELRVTEVHGRFEDEGWRVRKDGSRFWASVLTTALRSPSGGLRGFAQIMRDVTERREQEQALRASEERFRLLVDSVRDYAIYLLDPRGIITTWNAGARQIKGYEAHEVLGTHFSRFYPSQAVLRGWPEHELRVAAMEGSFEDEGWRVRKDGSRFWANVVITALRDHKGDLWGYSKIVRDLSTRRRQEETLRQSEERFRLLVEGIRGSAIFMLDSQGSVTSWNAGAERITGYTADDIIDRHFSRFYRPDDVMANKPWRELAAAREQGQLEAERLLLRKDGSTFWANIVITALHDGDRRLYGFAMMVQDLTQQRHTQALEDASRRMNEFIAMLAHELRNPLAPICNAVSLMAMKGLDDPVLESMRQTISRQTAHLVRIVEDLLDVNRITHGKFTIERQPLDLAEVVSRAIEASRPLIDAHRHTFTVSTPAGEVPICGDPVRLTQVVVNLLNNAAKYTRPGGQIWLTVSSEATLVELRVRDNGLGIKKEMLGKVFELFAQGQDTLVQAEGGLGLGLALVRRIVELHGGSVEAHSEGRDKGSEFIVRLPKAVPSPSEVLSRAPADQHSQASPRRILIVDDNVDAAASFGLLLTSMGQEVELAYDGSAALEAAARFRPDIVMLDIGLPKLNGYEVARRLRDSSDGSKLILVAVTGWGQDSDKRRAQEAGFDYHFVKPVGDEALRQLLDDTAVRVG